MRNVTREDRVAEFNRAGENKTFEEGGDFTPQLTCFAEELQEFNEALSDYVLKPTKESRKAMIKEWADVQVTLSNFAWFFDFDGDAAFNRVADSNMSKVINGKIFKREDGKILKPDTYKAPDMSGL